VLRWEAGAMGANHGVQAVTLAGERGALDPAEVRAVIRAPYVHAPRTGLVCVEQTHMGAGGAVVPLENLRELRAVTLELGVPLHMDGARLANAVVASGVTAERYAACADSVSLCFSKGLGAPVGSVVCADDDEWRERARVVRKRLGGWMRQSGILAAACLFALERNVERLAEDHALARALATALDGLPGLSCPPESVETNIVMVEVDGGSGYDAPGLAQALAEHGVRVSNLEPTALRFITHMDVGPSDLERLEQALEKLLGARARQNSGGGLP
jgi:threonine aldolase